MNREISAMDVRKNFGELLNEVKYLKDTIIIKKTGKPVAAIIDMSLFEKLSDLQTIPSSLKNNPDKETDKYESQVATMPGF